MTSFEFCYLPLLLCSFDVIRALLPPFLDSTQAFYDSFCFILTLSVHRFFVCFFCLPMSLGSCSLYLFIFDFFFFLIFFFFFFFLGGGGGVS